LIFTDTPLAQTIRPSVALSVQRTRLPIFSVGRPAVGAFFWVAMMPFPS